MSFASRNLKVVQKTSGRTWQSQGLIEINLTFVRKAWRRALQAVNRSVMVKSMDEEKLNYQMAFVKFEP